MWQSLVRARLTRCLARVSGDPACVSTASATPAPRPSATPFAPTLRCPPWSASIEGRGGNAPHCVDPPLSRSLTNNAIDDPGTAAIAEGLRANAALTELKCAQSFTPSLHPLRVPTARLTTLIALCSALQVGPKQRGRRRRRCSGPRAQVQRGSVVSRVRDGPEGALTPGCAPSHPRAAPHQPHRQQR